MPTTWLDDADMLTERPHSRPFHTSRSLPSARHMRGKRQRVSAEQPTGRQPYRVAATHPGRVLQASCSPSKRIISNCTFSGRGEGGRELWLLLLLLFVNAGSTPAPRMLDAASCMTSRIAAGGCGPATLPLKKAALSLARRLAPGRMLLLTALSAACWSTTDRCTAWKYDPAGKHRDQHCWGAPPVVPLLSAAWTTVERRI